MEIATDVGSMAGVQEAAVSQRGFCMWADVGREVNQGASGSISGNTSLAGCAVASLSGCESADLCKVMRRSHELLGPPRQWHAGRILDERMADIVFGHGVEHRAHRLFLLA